MSSSQSKASGYVKSIHQKRGMTENSEKRITAAVLDGVDDIIRKAIRDMIIPELLRKKKEKG